MTTGTDFFGAVTLPAPRVDEAWARRVVRESFGIDAVAHQLGSNQDANFLIRRPDGEPIAVLKVTNPAFVAAEVAVQDDAADRVATACPDLRIAQVLRGDDGVAQRTTVATPDGPAVARLIRFLDGGTLFDKGYLDPRSVARLGEVAAKVDLALAGLTDNAHDRVLQWDLQYADRTVAALGSSLPAARRAQIESAAARAWDLVAPLVPDLPVQVVHLDLTDDNTVLGPESVVDEVIDFSDVTRTWTVCELAITISSVLHHPGAEPASVLPAVRAYHSLRPLSEAEVEALWPLVVLRAAVLVVSGCHQVAVDGDNDYPETRLVREWRIADQALSVPPQVMTALIRHTLGLGSTDDEEAGPGPLPDGVLLALPDAAVLDLSPQSSLLDHGAWEDAEIAETLAADRLAAGHRAVVTTFGEARLAGSRALVQESPASVATGIDLWTAGSEELSAPWDCEVSSDVSGIVLRTDHFEVVARDVTARATGAVVAGTVVATTVPRGRTRITVGHRAGGVPEGVAAPYAPGWLSTLADPAPLLGLPATGAGHTGSAAESVLEQRERALAEVQEHYYREPPRIERGWRHILITEEGRPLLDMINNVAVVGHSHPRIARTAERQLRLLNTNSRFNYEAIATFGARLADLAPDPLDTVFLVNSGSEATDLAIRLALVATGRSDMVAMSEAYHGWTYASDAVSTSVADNPNALQSRPSWVHTVPAPNPYRGQHRGTDASRYGPKRLRPSTSSPRPDKRRPASSASPTTATPAGCRCPRDTSPPCTPRCAATVALPLPTRSRSATAGSVTGSGVSSSKASCPTSSLWRRPWGTAFPWALSSPAATWPTRTARPATSSPPPVVARCPHASVLPCSTSSVTRTCRETLATSGAISRRDSLSWRSDTRSSVRSTAMASTWAWSWFATGPPSSRRRVRQTPSAIGCSTWVS